MGRPKKEEVSSEIKPTIENETNPTETITTEKKVETKKEDVVEVNRADFNKMMEQLEKQAKDIGLLYQVADKSRLARAQDQGENLVKQAKVSTWDDTGKFIIGWKLITNKCEVVMGRWMEEQTVTIVFEDGETLTVPLIEFYRKTLHKISADIIARTEQYDEKNNKINMFKLQFPTGKILLINSAFIN